MNPWWYIHIATLYQLSCRWTRDDIYITHFYINFPGDKHLMIYTFRNFLPTFLHQNTWWYIHTATLHQLSCRWTPYDIYILQLYINFTADEHLMIYTYRNFIPTLLHTNTWWYIHTETLYQFLLQMNTWKYIQISTFFQLPCRWTGVDIFMRQLYIIFLFDEDVMIDIFAAALYQLSCR